MFAISLRELADLVSADPVVDGADQKITRIQTDSRAYFDAQSLFVALKGPHFDGHDFLTHVAAAGGKAALVARGRPLSQPTGLVILRVADPLVALQKLAAEVHRRANLPTLAITGSNGKTICKDLLVAFLSNQIRVTASPGSYNSQVGVALSLLGLDASADVAIVEAGISEPGEMTRLEAMIRPTFGLLTNIGFAHLEGMGTQATIAREKCQLFKNLPRNGWLLTPHDLAPAFAQWLPDCPRHGFGAPTNPGLPCLTKLQRLATNQSLTEWQFPGSDPLLIPVPIDAAWKEMFHTVSAAVSAAFLLGIPPHSIADTLRAFEPPQNCIELWESQQGFTLINDSYSSDPVSVQAGLKALGSFVNKRKFFLFGGMQGLGNAAAYQHRLIGEAAAREGVDHFVSVGSLAQSAGKAFEASSKDQDHHHFENLSPALAFLKTELGPQDALLIKGPRKDRFHQVAHQLKGLLSPTSFTINLSKIRHNLAAFQAMFESKPKILVMVKAFAYGMDAVVVSRYLQDAGVEYFGVAYLNEAVELRRNGIHVSMVVQMVQPDDAETVVRFNLEPVVFTTGMLAALSEAAEKLEKKVSIHLKIDTGMGRFGLFPEEIDDFLDQLARYPSLELHGVMTHFSAADDPAADSFSMNQLDLFQQCLRRLEQRGLKPALVHAAATAAAVRFPQARFNMVRLGLGLYGVPPSAAVAASLPQPLVCPFSLMSRLGIVKTYPKGYPISYNRRYQTTRPSRIGFVPMGYHDGLGYGLANKGHVKIAGLDAPMVGSICMDFTAVDVTDIETAQPGSPVLILGQHEGHVLEVDTMARMSGTIPYEVLSRLSRRIQRIYIIEEH